MAKKTEKRKLIGLICDACGHRHYYTVKNTQNTTDKIELNKYCPKNRSTAKQVETKKNLGVNVVKKRKG